MSARNAIYLDSNAGAPLRPEAQEALHALFKETRCSNPSSVHSHGRLAKRWMTDARDSVGQSIGCSRSSDQIIFTSSGTEANQLAVRSVFEPLFSQGLRPHWITTPVEHDSVLQMIPWVKSRGGDVSLLPVNSEGEIDVEFLPNLIRPKATALVSAVWANNETGVLLNVKRLVRLSKKAGIRVHLDAAQAWGKVFIHVGHLEADLVSFSAHKIGALAGLGFLWCSPGQIIRSPIFGAQERSRRGGTENLAGIVAAGAVAKTLDPREWVERVEPLRNRLENAIASTVPSVRINGKMAPRIANTLNLSFEGLSGEGLVMSLDLEGFSVSAGSACSSGAMEPSHVLLAMGRGREEALSSIRVSFADEMPWEVLEAFVGTLKRVVTRILCK